MIVTGNGTSFCAGGDLDFLHTGDRDVVALRDKMTRSIRLPRPARSRHPTIAAINGPAIGAGLCPRADVRHACCNAEGADGDDFVRIGLHPGMMATALLPRAVSHTWAAELCYTGRSVTGAEALHMGLVNRAVPPDQLMTEARRLAEQVAANATVALRYVKQGLLHLPRHAADKASAWEGFAQPVTMATEDVQEGLQGRPRTAAGNSRAGSSTALKTCL